MGGGGFRGTVGLEVTLEKLGKKTILKYSLGITAPFPNHLNLWVQKTNKKPLNSFKLYQKNNLNLKKKRKKIQITLL